MAPARTFQQESGKKLSPARPAVITTGGFDGSGVRWYGEVILSAGQQWYTASSERVIQRPQQQASWPLPSAFHQLQRPTRAAMNKASMLTCSRMNAIKTTACPRTIKAW